MICGQLGIYDIHRGTRVVFEVQPLILHVNCSKEL